VKVGMSTASFFPNEIMQGIDNIASMGIDTCEVFFNTYSEYRPEFASQLKKRADENGIKIHSVHALTTQFEPQLFSPHEIQYKDALNMFLRVADAAKILDAKFYTFHGQAFYKRNAKGNMQRTAERLSALTEKLKDRDLKLSLENVHWATFNKPSLLDEMKKYDELTDLFFTLDIKQAVQSCFEPSDYIKAMGDKISTVHLCDYVQKEANIETCLPGRGEVDFLELKKEIDKSGSSPAYIIEVYKGDYEDIEELKNSTIFLEDKISD